MTDAAARKPDGFEFCFADDQSHDRLFVEINYRDCFVAIVSYESNSAGIRVEWPDESFYPRCQSIEIGPLVEALEYAKRMIQAQYGI
jgi:hypothetical protein